MQCHYSAMARDDLVSIARLIAQDQPEQARTFAAEQRECCSMLARHPGMGHQISQLNNMAHQFTHGHFVILFCPLTNGVRIERVLRNTQDLPAAISLDLPAAI
jgi:toxin ParE1/3/4